MAFKLTHIIVLASTFLLVTARMSSEEERYVTMDLHPPAPSPAPAAAPPAHHIAPVEEKECPKLCDMRCSKHSRPNHCHRVCQTCCRRCKCVPPGTSGNREMCGTCYTAMTTHRNATKCP